jgi:flagellar protein FliO/FliZ
MTWMLIRLVLSLAFVGLILWFAARVAKKRGLGGSGAGVIEIVARQRMGRSSTVNVVRIGDVVLVVGATEEQVTLLAEVDVETVEAALGERDLPRARRAPRATYRPEVDEVDEVDDDEWVDDYPVEDPHAQLPHAELPHAANLHPANPHAANPHAAHPHAGGQHSGGLHRPAAARQSSGALAGSVFDRNGWGSVVNQMRERTVRRP